MTTFTYDETGQALSSRDPNGNVTTYSYADNYASGTGTAPGNTDAFLTQLTLPAIGGVTHIEKFTYGYSDGQLRSSIDQNNQATSYQYNDPFLRPTQLNYPDGGQATLSYNDTAPTPTATTSRKMNSSGQLITGVTLMDGIGHVKQTQLTSDPQGTDFSDTAYDGLGRARTISNPHRTAASTTDGTTTYVYDALGRTASVTLQEGSVVATSYSGNTTTVTDPASKKRQSTTDGLGRLTQVVEDPGGLGYVTTYSYNALDNLIGVVQNGSRQRTFVYDSLSRLTSAANPESGTITYGYDANGNLLTKTAPAPNQQGTTTVTTTYHYDALNRLTQKSYSDGTTPTANFMYDTPSSWGATITNVVGRLSEAWISGTPWAGQIFSYDSLGRTVINNQCVPSNCGTTAYGLGYTYDLAGNLLTYSSGIGGVSFTQTFDTAGRVTGLTSSINDAQHPATLATVNSSAGYLPTGAMRSVHFGNSFTQTTMYNNRLQPCRMNVNDSNTTLNTCADALPANNMLDFNYGYNSGTTNNGNVAAWTATGWMQFNRSYTYDHLNRLATTTDSDSTDQACTGLSWSYDAWGNRTDQTVTNGTCNSFHASVNIKNQLVDPVNNVYQYDAAGNLTADGNHTYTYDAENRLTKVDGGNTAIYMYDALGQRARKTVGTLWTDFLRDLSGNVTMDFSNACSTPPCWSRGYIYLDGQQIAEYGNGTTFFMHKDHLGSTRLVSDVTGNYITDCFDFYPFGELNVPTTPCSSGNSAPTHSNSTHKFTGKERDTESGLDNFGARYNSSSMGRFMSPDPNNAGEIDENPQSWNGYAYALNNPLRYTDPDGTNVLVCIDGQDKCHNYTDDQYARLLKEQNGQQGINLPNQGLPHGDITCGGVKCGTATYFDPGIESANGANFAIGGLFKFAIEGGISLLEGLFGSGARTAGQVATGATTNAVQGPAQQIVANGTKQAVRDALESSGLSDAAKATIKGALRRGAAGDSYTVEKLADGSVTITREVAGQAGGRAAYEQVIDGATGATKSVVQKAYDASGNLVHVDPKFP